MCIIKFEGNCVLFLLIAWYLAQCLSHKRAGFVSTLTGFTDNSERKEHADYARNITESNTHLLTDNSRFKPYFSSSKLPVTTSILKAPTTYLTKRETSKESELSFARSQLTNILHCNNTSNATFASADSPCSTTVNSGQITVDCSGLSQRNINPAWFPTNTNVILLDNNRFTAIQNCTFSHLQDLRRLSISRNRITHIDIDAFTGLVNLESLNLEYNKLGYAYLYPPNVFKPLRKLKELRIQNNIDSSGENCIPGIVLGTLKNLESLTVDTVGNRLCFEEEFAGLKYLQSLNIFGNSKYIDDKSFENVRQISSLQLQGRPMSNISEAALEPLTNLDSLYFTGVDFGVEKSLLAVKPLRGRNMTVIYFYSVDLFEHDSYAGFIRNDGVLTLSKTQYLLDICVREFTLIGSEIYVIKENALSSEVWERCLVKLDLSSNPLLGTKVAYLRFFNFKNIESINMNGMMQSCSSESGADDSDDNAVIKAVATTSIQLLPAEETETNYHGAAVYDTNMKEQHHISSYKPSVLTEGKIQRADACPSSPSDKYFVWLTVSNSLQRLQLHESISRTRFDVNVRFVGAQSLTYLDIGRGKVSQFQGTFTGLDALQTFILSGNDLSSLSEAFFDSFCNLEVLLLSDSSLGVDFISRNSDRLLMNLRKLKRLDISLNLLNSLAADTFTFNRKLEVLNLAKNRFRTIPFNLRKTPNLKVLDIRKNSLSTIERTDRELLDILAKQPDGFKLLLSGNEISCDCNNFPFLRWLTTTHVQLDDITLGCFDNNINTTNFHQLVDVDIFFRRCLGGLFLTVAISHFLLTVIGFLVFFFVLKHQIFLRSAILQFFTGYKLKVQSDYRIGVFIGYSEHDYAFPCFVLRTFIEDELGLKTYLYHRDMSGADMARSISDAINASWRIILVVTSSFLFQDEWSTFTYTSAIHSQTSENPSRIVVLVDRSLHHHLPAEILGAINDDNIIVVPHWSLTYTLRQKLRTRLMQQ